MGYVSIIMAQRKIGKKERMKKRMLFFSFSLFWLANTAYIQCAAGSMVRTQKGY